MYFTSLSSQTFFIGNVKMNNFRNFKWQKYFTKVVLNKISGYQSWPSDYIIIMVTITSIPFLFDDRQGTSSDNHGRHRRCTKDLRGWNSAGQAG